MAGKNPYLPEQKTEKPKRAYRIRFEPSGTVIEVDPNKIPYDDHGLEGSLLEIALGNGIDIDHACGGVSACSTCHVHVRRGLETCNEPLDEELDQLDNAPATSFQSRLACQCIPNGEAGEVVVEIPKWNRNLIREGH